MNAAQIHLALNHAPLFLSLLGGGMLLLGMIKKNESFKNLSLYFLVAAALLTVPVFFTGEGTEELIEHLPGVNENAIERHEDTAKISLIIMIATGIVSLLGLFLRKKTGIAKYIFLGVLLLSLVSFGTMVQTAHLGGLIRHTELQDGATSETNENDKESEEENESNSVVPQEKQTGKDSLSQFEKTVDKKDDD